MKMKNALVSLVMLLATGLYSSYAGAASIYAFGHSEMTVPAGVTTGTVFSRYTFTPNDLCGKIQCEITGAIRYNKGNIWASGVNGASLETNVPGVSVILRLDGRIVDSDRFNGSFSNVGEVQLVKNNNAIASGKFASGSFNMYFILNYKDGLFGDSSSIYLAGSVRAIAGACKVPGAEIKLPDVSLGQFGGVGSTIGATPFVLRFNECPAGFNRVGFGLFPVHGVAATVPGTLKLAPDSTATGIGIKLTEHSGMPAQFEISQSLVEYDRSTGGSYTIPMVAAYARTETSIRAGPVKAMMVVLLDYQ